MFFRSKLLALPSALLSSVKNAAFYEALSNENLTNYHCYSMSNHTKQHSPMMNLMV